MTTVFCDTDCELNFKYAEEYDVQVIRMPYTLGDKELLADLGQTFDAKAFYAAMREGASATTAGLNDTNYYEIFKPFFERGDDILYITFSSKMSATFTYLDLAINRLKTEYPNVKYRQFDTLNISLGAGVLVYLGAKYCREHGGDVDATCEYLSSIINKVAVYFVVEDMKYLARGGRISPAKAKIGNIIQIKPVLTVVDGKLDVVAKPQGMKKAYNVIFDTFEKDYEPLDGAPIIVLDADNPVPAEDFVRRVKEVHPEVKEVWHFSVGPVVGAHAGPGTVALIYPRRG